MRLDPLDPPRNPAIGFLVSFLMLLAVLVLGLLWVMTLCAVVFSLPFRYLIDQVKNPSSPHTSEV